MIGPGARALTIGHTDGRAAPAVVLASAAG